MLQRILAHIQKWAGVAIALTLAVTNGGPETKAERAWELAIVALLLNAAVFILSYVSMRRVLKAVRLSGNLQELAIRSPASLREHLTSFDTPAVDAFIEVLARKNESWRRAYVTRKSMQ
jgi:hypothetical protein